MTEVKLFFPAYVQHEQATGGSLCLPGFELLGIELDYSRFAGHPMRVLKSLIRLVGFAGIGPRTIPAGQRVAGLPPAIGSLLQRIYRVCEADIKQ